MLERGKTVHVLDRAATLLGKVLATADYIVALTKQQPYSRRRGVLH
jgi:hypothetical protein